MTIFLLEDDANIAAGLRYALEREGFRVEWRETVQGALSYIADQDFDLALLDMSLPDGSGLAVCQAIKAQRGKPVIFLTVMDEELNIVMGLDSGADDYVTKPFRLRELISRIHSVLRRYRAEPEESPWQTLGDLQIDARAAKVKKHGKELSLTALEYRFLLVFLKHKGQVLTRSMLLENIWDLAGDFVNDNTLSVYIRRLREKIEDDPQQPKIILTVRGLGYKAGGH